LTERLTGEIIDQVSAAEDPGAALSEIEAELAQADSPNAGRLAELQDRLIRQAEEQINAEIEANPALSQSQIDDWSRDAEQKIAEHIAAIEQSDNAAELTEIQLAQLGGTDEEDMDAALPDLTPAPSDEDAASMKILERASQRGSTWDAYAEIRKNTGITDEEAERVMEEQGSQIPYESAE
jgi:hypothetical protein